MRTKFGKAIANYAFYEEDSEHVFFDRIRRTNNKDYDKLEFYLSREL